MVTLHYPGLKTLLEAGSYDLVIWDFDGVIVDSEPLHRESYLRMLCARGFTPRSDFFTGLIGLNEGQIWKLLIAKFDIHDDASKLRSERIELFRKDSQRLCLTWFSLILLEHFRATNARQVILSSGNQEVTEELLSRLGIKHYFDAISAWTPDTSESEAKPKVMESLLKTSLRGLVIEDNPTYLRLAQSLGSSTVGVTHSNNDLIGNDADYVLCIDNDKSF